MDKDKLKAAFTQIEKQHGAGTVFRLGSSRRLNVEVIPTGVLGIDIGTGVGGFPRGRIIEIYGPPSGGKTTLTLMTIAAAQRRGEAAAFIDAEHALDPTYARRLGVDVDNLIVSQPSCGEQALEVAETLIKSEQFGIVVVDSVAGLVPKKELEGEMGEPQMGMQARLMSQSLRKLNGVVSTTKTVLAFINQTRNKLGVMFGSPETTPGGDALKFWSSMRITVRPGQHIKRGDQEVGIRTKIKFVKNKVAAPFKEVEVDQIFGDGFDPLVNLIEPALTIGILTKSGACIYYGEEMLGRGKEDAIESLRLQPDLAGKIYIESRDKAFASPLVKEETTQECQTPQS